MTDLDSYLASFDAEPGYLDWAAFGPLSASVRDEVIADVALLGTGRRSGIDLVADHARDARALLAELLDAEPDELTLQPSTAYGLMQAIYGVSGSLLLAPSEFPSLTIAATRAADSLGRLAVHWLETPDGVVTPEIVRDSLTDETSAVAVSLVDFRTGYRADLSALRDVIGDRLLIVDAVQGFGIVQADYAAADVVCGNGYKWLRAGRGTGFAWFGPRARERITPVLSGFAGTDGDLPVDALPAPAMSARAFTVSPPDHLAAARLAAALREVRDVGVAVIEREITARTDEVIFIADRYEIPVVTSRDPQQRAGIVALAPAAHDVAALGAALANHGVSATTRSGQVRIAPHVGTGEDTMQLLGDALAASRAW
ncbi:MAG: aminotransferase class V-fold PLP-dependent enzyme [Actinobacteria bacterium]|nr:aminotransferase class V-fold PLP-dependent enzyme [Actinomycetota bacterium]